MTTAPSTSRSTDGRARRSTACARASSSSRSNGFVIFVRCCLKGHADGRPEAEFARDRNPAAMILGDAARDGQAQSAAPRSRMTPSNEFATDAIDLVFWDAHPMIGDLDRDVFSVR